MTDAGQSLTRGGIVICFHGRLVRLHRTGIDADGRPLHDARFVLLDACRLAVSGEVKELFRSDLWVLHSDGKIERGKLLKESLHGCYTSRRASE